ncbi:hypothetical protein NON08_04325 [Cetobacterium somerae]|uniref:hypothetical protein n=1 Tax=Cetobacterium sp. NK01 TaxID=2993530 RepID=UPI002116CB39|nr:hypothetical protein [Cetobacterium sp. NK01]MCQ8211780.1 hypothetical protein [Cetobacterium sp. NK01]
MKNFIIFGLISLTICSTQILANPGKGKAKGHIQKHINSDTNWGQNKDFLEWLNMNPSFKNKDRKKLEKFYKEQLKEEKRLRKVFAKYNNEISTLPAYKSYHDPLKYFINDLLYNPNKINHYNFSHNFKQTLTKEEKIAVDFLRLIENFK